MKAATRVQIREALEDAAQEVVIEIETTSGDSSDSWSGDDVEVEWMVRTPTERSE